MSANKSDCSVRRWINEPICYLYQKHDIPQSTWKAKEADGIYYPSLLAPSQISSDISAKPRPEVDSVPRRKPSLFTGIWGMTTCYRQTLQLYAEQHRLTLDKSIAAGRTGQGTLFTCTWHIEGLVGESLWVISGKPATSKANAEESAAEIAIKNLKDRCRHEPDHQCPGQSTD
ncbi:hypothetical protein FRC19_011213 [Serendipita sp. 401]|nr:hypothetical protein FRC19_011213 [Serendipita sp. 401]KAG9047760.1 hypothetical protein FS842_000580 [Serendipita sp. 407]